ncbi:hypothetical protein NUBL17191_04990 [Klebsiella pneumoniae]|nr:hypothetical protein MS5786_45540 [Klebsiella pneumoniae]GKO07494.1 hypothetical protein NUBL17191_04990 [Klebsiella pneumoniae]
MRTTLSWLNSYAIASHITNDMRHNAGDSDIVQGLAFYCFAIFGYQRPPSQRGKFSPAAVLDKNLTTLLWLQGNIQHNITAIPFENASVRPDIADRVNGQSLLDVVRRG